MALVAKMRCDVVTRRNMGTVDGEPHLNEEVEWRAVYSEDDDNPNSDWAEATPDGQLRLTINNQDALGFAEPGAEYIVEIRKHMPQKARHG